jgi:ribosomal protein S18 acetylase RimI-like enzyme
MKIEIIKADLERVDHQNAVVYLLDEYAKDLLGYLKPLPDIVKKNLVSGLKDHPTTLIWLALADDKYAGIAICFKGFSTFAAKPLINIHDISVLKEFRGMKIGKLLISEIERTAVITGCCKITLEVQENNLPAINLYEKSGFIQSTLAPEAGCQFFYTKLLEEKDN